MQNTVGASDPVQPAESRSGTGQHQVARHTALNSAEMAAFVLALDLAYAPQIRQGLAAPSFQADHQRYRRRLLRIPDQFPQRQGQFRTTAQRRQPMRQIVA